jgi:hypothetical protein
MLPLVAPWATTAFTHTGTGAQVPGIPAPDPSKMGPFWGSEPGKVPQNRSLLDPFWGSIQDPDPGVHHPTHLPAAGCGMGAVRPLTCPAGRAVSLELSSTGYLWDLDPKRGLILGAWSLDGVSELSKTHYFVLRSDSGPNGNGISKWPIWPVWIQYLIQRGVPQPLEVSRTCFKGSNLGCIHPYP